MERGFFLADARVCGLEIRLAANVLAELDGGVLGGDVGLGHLAGASTLTRPQLNAGRFGARPLQSSKPGRHLTDPDDVEFTRSLRSHFREDAPRDPALDTCNRSLDIGHSLPSFGSAEQVALQRDRCGRPPDGVAVSGAKSRPRDTLVADRLPMPSNSIPSADDC